MRDHQAVRSSTRDLLGAALVLLALNSCSSSRQPDPIPPGPVSRSPKQTVGADRPKQRLPVAPAPSQKSPAPPHKPLPPPPSHSPEKPRAEPTPYGPKGIYNTEVSLVSLKAENIEEFGSDELMIAVAVASVGDDGFVRALDNSWHSHYDVKQGDLLQLMDSRGIRIFVPVDGSLRISAKVYEIDDEEDLEVITSSLDEAKTPYSEPVISRSVSRALRSVDGAHLVKNVDIIEIIVEAAGVVAQFVGDNNDLLGATHMDLSYAELRHISRYSSRGEYTIPLDGVNVLNSYRYILKLKVTTTIH